VSEIFHRTSEADHEELASPRWTSRYRTFVRPKELHNVNNSPAAHTTPDPGPGPGRYEDAFAEWHESLASTGTVVRLGCPKGGRTLFGSHESSTSRVAP